MTTLKKKSVAIISLVILAFASILGGSFYFGLLSLSGITFTINVSPLQGSAPLNVAVTGNFGGYGAESITLIVDNNYVDNVVTDSSGNYMFSYTFAFGGEHTVQAAHFAEREIGRPIEYFTSTMTVVVTGGSATHQLNVICLGSGYTMPSGLNTYANGQVVTIEAFGNGNGGPQFDHWVLDGQVLTDTSSLTVTMDADHSVSAVFSGYTPPPPPAPPDPMLIIYIVFGVISAIVLVLVIVAAMKRRRRNS
jgi:hypothetical protein